MNLITRSLLLNSRCVLIAKKTANAMVGVVIRRPIWDWLNQAWNQYDAKRVEEIGPNRACTEWLLKCGAQVKFKNWGNYLSDYNKIPPGAFEAFQIEEIRAENACIMARGFEYLKGLNSLRSIRLVNCELIDDAALGKLSYVRNSLQELQMVFCPSVTDTGLSYLYLLQNLKKLVLIYLPNVKDHELAEKLLREKLPPGCKIMFTQKEPTEEDLKNLDN